MNWLAHFLLSEPSPRFRIGNVLPDIVGPALISGMDIEYRRGAACHHAIDDFTDSHAVVHRSISRFAGVRELRHMGGVLTDMLYDHLLAQDCFWAKYSPSVPLPDFAAQIYDGIRAREHELPGAARSRLRLMCEHDWLVSYRDAGKIRLALQRMGARLRRPVDLSVAMPVFERAREAFSNDFAEFFPQLVRHVSEMEFPESMLL
ncbi:acyl carrier protein phosphodiesterase [Ereboglobus sp. PH5-5]|uniref:acyl carrier protein phosphodiesterase n=1 Tax=unclassified Ereboglobus TaxID=2626932 RepID=UPI002404EB2C|nr:MULTISPECIES: acyl carrier protein phosphodiesterase [unclassified Ereboglobus]MDF9828119.1 acyl carrier protein phosphodiesterase [Ereboglobus sp. PH5-10]MDF9833063.1 acyl carrier protein phosphodiesterase [Ereboglobus sp. PH5-5]